MVSLSPVEGEKSRLGGQLLLVIFALIVGASIRALLLKLLAQCPATSGFHYSPVSSASFLDSHSFDWTEDQWIPFHRSEDQSPFYYGGSVKMHSLRIAAAIFSSHFPINQQS